MDVVKKKQKTSRFSGQHKMMAVLLIALVVLGILANQSGGAVSVQRGNILIGTVQTGDLDVTIEGYGHLTSDKQQLITASSVATVKEVVLKPGAIVTSDSVIVRLENPELAQQVQSDMQELALMTANLRQIKLNNKRESLNERASVAALTAQYKTAKLKREAEETLVESGIVSQLTYKESVLNEQQLGQQVDILKERSEQLIEVHLESVNIQQEKIKQYQGRLSVSRERLEKLEVRAGFDGVLQRLSVDLGQSVTAGQEVALIGSLSDLIALIKVPQSQVQQIVVGQKAIIDTRQDKIEGTVARIDPVVADGTVNIEISLPKSLPKSARPQLNVDGIIIAQTLTGVNYIERPVNVQANSQGKLYLLDDRLENAELKTLSFGRQAGRYIEVVSGASRQQQYIISDMSSLVTKVSKLAVKS